MSKTLMTNQQAAGLLGYTIGTFYALVSKNRAGRLVPPLPPRRLVEDKAGFISSELLEWQAGYEAIKKKVKEGCPSPNQQYVDAVRTHIVLERKTWEVLKERAFAKDVSLTHLINKILESSI